MKALDKTEKDALRQTLQFTTLKEAVAIALAQIQTEADNKLRTFSPSDPYTVEEALRAQGTVRGAARLLELLHELTGETDDAPG